MLRLQPEIAARLDKYVEQVAASQARSARGVGRTGVIRYALAQFLDAQEAEHVSKKP